MLVAACGDAHGHSAATIADSVGVQIVTSTGPSWEESEGWVIDSQPLLDIGGSDADPHYDLFRVSGVTRLSDGRLAVLNSGTSEVRYYDSTGTWLSSSGRKGQGPGEFESAGILYRLPGDTLFIYDYDPHRLTKLDPNGSFVTSISLVETNGGRQIIPFGRFADGSWAAIVGSIFGIDAQAGLTRPPEMLLHIASDFRQVNDTIVTLPGYSAWVETGESNGGRFMSVRSPPFPLSSPHRVGDSLIYAGDGAQFAIGVYKPDGTLVRSIRYSVPRTPVTDELLVRVKANEMSKATDRDRADREARWERIPKPGFLAAFSGLIVDADGNLWVLDPHPLPSDPVAANVFGPDGILLGQVELPVGFTPFEIGGDYVLGVWRDDVDLEHARMYRIIKDS
jgi:hypothetical protein